VDRIAVERPVEFHRWVQALHLDPQPLPSERPLLIALDLDDTIWDTDAWMGEMNDRVDPVIADLLPKAYAAGTRYRDEATVQRIHALRESVPGIAHDHEEIRRRAYFAAAEEHGDDTAAVPALVSAYMQQRSEAAFQHLFPDTLPFLNEARCVRSNWPS
jgi:hypothetical protein